MSELSIQRICPLCGQANACAMAGTDPSGQSCWCMSAAINPESVNKIPPDLRGVSCVCQACASLPDSLNPPAPVSL